MRRLAAALGLALDALVMTAAMAAPLLSFARFFAG